MNDETNKNCGPIPCQCCECQGKKCLTYHPGHDHRMYGIPAADWINDATYIHGYKGIDCGMVEKKEPE